LIILLVGVGVRISIYIQASLAIGVVLSVYIRICWEQMRWGCTRSEPDYFKETALLQNQLALTLLMTGGSLVISAIIEAKSTAGSGLSIYHALVVLNLSWINSSAGFALHSLATFTDIMSFGAKPLSFRFAWHLRQRLGVFSAHSTTMALMGIWFWADPDSFGGRLTVNTACAPQIRFWAFTTIDVTNPKLRLISILAYSSIAIPILSSVIQTLPSLLVVVAVAIIEQRFSMQKSRPFFLASAILSLIPFIGPTLYFIIATERLIITNRNYVDYNVEGQWTYGQTLALGAAVISTALVLSELWDMRRRRADNIRWSTAVSKLHGAMQEPLDWRNIRAVATELHRISRANAVRELHHPHLANTNELSSLARQSMEKVDGAPPDAWDQMRLVSEELEALSIGGLCMEKE
jgi:hypothetical protein